MLVRTLMVRHSTLAREKGLDLAFRRRLSRENGRSVLKSGQDFGKMATSEAANGKSQVKRHFVFSNRPAVFDG